MEKLRIHSQSDHERMDSWGGLEKETSKIVMENYENLRLEPLSGIETAKLASKVYEILGSELGCRLAEPNIILLIAGLKGHADIPWVKIDGSKILKLEEINTQLKNYDLEIYYPKKIKDDSKITSLTLVNLKGVEIKSKTTRIPGVPPYDRNLGREELMSWYKKVNILLGEAQKSGKIPKEVDIKILIEGIDLGYPDQAIFDFEKCLREGKIHDDLLEADILSSIPEAIKYQGAVPEFDYYPEHKDDPEIIDYVSTAKKILEEFYQSDWFKELSRKQEFQESRQETVQIEKEGLLKRDLIRFDENK
ncbi:MAG: hypothetical protein PHW92_15255 [Lutibacter sp.]|nr:hypothetical protein [Lutibacter sp.]